MSLNTTDSLHTIRTPTARAPRPRHPINSHPHRCPSTTRRPTNPPLRPRPRPPLRHLTNTTPPGSRLTATPHPPLSQVLGRRGERGNGRGGAVAEWHGRHADTRCGKACTCTAHSVPRPPTHPSVSTVHPQMSPLGSTDPTPPLIFSMHHTTLQARIVLEEQQKLAAEEEDATDSTSVHAMRLRERGVRVDFLLMLTHELNLWEWATVGREPCI